MAVNITRSNQLSEDVLQDTYIKLYESGKTFEQINTCYIYFTMKSVFLDTVKQSSTKNRIILVDEFPEIIDNEVIKKIVTYKDLNNFEKILISSLYGREITNDKNEIVRKYQGESMLSLSKNTGVPYRTIYTTVQRLKNKICLEMQ